MSPTHGHVTDLFLELEFQHKGNKKIKNVNSQQNIAVFSIAIDSENKIIQLLHRKGQKTRASEQGLTYTPGQCHRLIHKMVFKI